MDRDFIPRLEVQRQVADGPGGGALVLQVIGDLDAANAQILRDALVSAIDRECREPGCNGVIVVDMTDVNYIDSVGLGTLVSGLKRANEKEVALRFVVTNPQIQKVLNITGLVRLLEIHETRQHAVAGAGREGPAGVSAARNEGKP